MQYPGPRDREGEKRGTILFLLNMFRFEHAAIYTLPEYSAISKAECSTKSDIITDILREIADTKMTILSFTYPRVEFPVYNNYILIIWF